MSSMLACFQKLSIFICKNVQMSEIRSRSCSLKMTRNVNVRMVVPFMRLYIKKVSVAVMNDTSTLHEVKLTPFFFLFRRLQPKLKFLLVFINEWNRQCIIVVCIYVRINRDIGKRPVMKLSKRMSQNRVYYVMSSHQLSINIRWHDFIVAILKKR